MTDVAVVTSKRGTRHGLASCAHPGKIDTDRSGVGRGAGGVRRPVSSEQNFVRRVVRTAVERRLCRRNVETMAATQSRWGVSAGGARGGRCPRLNDAALAPPDD